MHSCNHLQLSVEIYDLQMLHFQFVLFIRVCVKQDEMTPYSFFVDDVEISDTLGKTLSQLNSWLSSEAVVSIIYQAQAAFRIHAVTRCTSTVEGHAEAVLSLQFSPNGRYCIANFFY